MPAILLAGPAAEPMTLAEARTYLRVEHDAEDGLIASLLTAARATVEALTGRVLIDQNWRIMRDTWPRDGVISVPVNPFREILAVHLLDESGVESPVPLVAFTADTARVPGRIHIVHGTLPVPFRPVAGIALDVKAGYGPEANHVPSPLVEAVRVVLAHFYEHRDTTGSGAAFPARLDTLVAPYRRMRL